ncbi:hypothetical protein ACF0H5_014800 [Mactra antiquata]
MEKCYHSMKKSDSPSKMMVTFCLQKHQRLNSPHVLAQLFSLVLVDMWWECKYKMLHSKALPADVAKTSQSQTWHEPRGEKIQGNAVLDANISGHSRTRTASSRDVKSALYNPIRGHGVDWIDHVKSLQASVNDTLILPAIKPDGEDIVPCKFDQVPQGSILSYPQRLEDYCILNLF